MNKIGCKKYAVLQKDTERVIKRNNSERKWKQKGKKDLKNESVRDSLTILS